MLLARPAAAAPRGTAAPPEVERPLRLLAAPAAAAASRPPRRAPTGPPPEAERAERRDHLHRRAVRLREASCAAPRGAGRSRPARAPAPPVQRAPQPQRRGDVVGGAPRLQLVEEPEPLLRERQRQRARARHRRPPAAAPAAPARRMRLHAPGQLPPPSGPSNERPQRQLHAEDRPGCARPPAWPAASARPARRSCRHAHPLDAQHLAQIPASTSSDRRARRHVLLRRGRVAPAPAAPCGPPSRCGVSGSASERHERARHHVLRQAPRRCVAQLARPPRRRRRTPPARWSPGRSSRSATTQSDTAACRRSAASISPSSMRKPRTFTCWSTRPRNSSRSPSASHRARSPVRYSRAPASRRTDRARTAPPSAPARPR